MKIAALYDIHGNSFALEAALGEIARERPDLILVGGDVVMGPFPLETLALLAQAPVEVRYIRGNADREVVNAGTSAADDAKPWAARAAWVKARLAQDQLGFLGALPEQMILDVDGLGPTLFCHGSPRSDEEIVTSLTSEERLREILHGVTQRTVVLGHTHAQFDRRAAGIRVINAGSVGLPYEDTPGAYWAVLDREPSLRCTPYDVARAGAATADSDFPEAKDFVRRQLFERPSRQQAAEFFEKMALERAKSPSG